jgi:hypothetical protein
VKNTVDLDCVESIVAVKRFRVQALQDCKIEFVTDSHLPNLESVCCLECNNLVQLCQQILD